jgi:hypothetical protein
MSRLSDAIAAAKEPPHHSTPFRRGLQGVTLIAVDKGIDLVVIAQFNPSQLQFEESANWSASWSDKESMQTFEFTGGTGRSVSFELFFDGYEAAPAHRNVKTTYVDKLARLLQVIDPDGPEAKRRPPLVSLAWGPGLPSFTGVLASLSTKLTMFLPDGTPVRATCSIKLLEASREALDRRPTNRVAPPPR